MVLGSATPLVQPAEDLLAVARRLGNCAGIAIGSMLRVDLAQYASEQLVSTSLRLQAVMDSSPQGMLVAESPTGHIVQTSHSLLGLLGQAAVPDVEVRDYPHALGLHYPNGAECRVDDLPWVQSAATGRPTAQIELAVWRPDGSVRAVLCSASPVRGADEQVVGVVAILQDISDLKEFEREKDEFVAIASHELKTPLTVLKGYVNLLERRLERAADLHKDEMTTRTLAILDQQVNRLNRLIFDLVDVSKVQAGRLDLQMVRFDLGKMTQEVADRLQVTVPSRVFETTAREGIIVEGDPHRLEQVLHNLLSNAVKATPEDGRIAVSVGPVDGQAVTRVTDNGTGIPEEVQPRVFQRFVRGHHESEGSGLGLFISKGIVEQHGGRIWFESEVGKGTSFYYSLPLVKG
ncbi:MAG: PAS domain-containing sensor histidine kinase [Chloroflexota bacterium]